MTQNRLEWQGVQTRALQFGLDNCMYDFRDRNSSAHFQVCSFTLTEFIYAFLPCIVSIAVKAEVESEFQAPEAAQYHKLV